MRTSFNAKMVFVLMLMIDVTVLKIAMTVAMSLNVIVVRTNHFSKTPCNYFEYLKSLNRSYYLGLAKSSFLKFSTYLDFFLDHPVSHTHSIHAL